MLDLIIIIILIFGIFIGLYRGFILQLLHIIGFITAFIIAALYYDALAERLKLWIPYQEVSDDSIWANFLQVLPVELAFYSIVSFAIIFFAVKIILQIIASMLDFVSSIPIIKTVNKLLGGVLGFVEVYLILFIILYVLVLTPMESVQEAINNSTFALRILENTPYFSERVLELISTYVNSES